MSADYLVNISWNAAHRKGFGPSIDDTLHAKWLWESVQLYKKSLGARVAVSMGGFRGVMNHRAGPERDYLWKVLDHCTIISNAEDPGSSQGHGFNILHGLEFCSKNGIKYVIQTAEDVVPKQDTIPTMLARLREGYDYSGYLWGFDDSAFCSQFFSCRANAIASTYDPAKQGDVGWIEDYLKWQFRDKSVNILPRPYGYHHSHVYDEWKQYLNSEYQGLIE